MSRSNRLVGPVSPGWIAAVFVLLAPIAATAQSFTHTGTLTGDEYWAEGDHTVTGHVTVPAGLTLTIEPGARINVSAGHTITIDGTLKVGVNGSGAADPSRPVLFFRSSPTSTAVGQWGGIVFNAGSSGHVFKNAEVRNAFDCITSYSTSGLTIEDSTIRYCYYNGIKVAASSASVVFKGSSAATVPTYGSSAGNAKAKISNCGTGASDAHGIYNLGALTVTNAEIYANGTTSSRSHGIRSNGNTQITGSILHSNTNYGVSWDGALPNGNNSLSRSLVFRNYIGGLFAQLTATGLTFLVDHNTFDDNDANGSSGSTYEIYAHVTQPGLTITNNIIGRNLDYGIYRSSTGALVNDHNVIWGNGFTHSNLTLGSNTTFCNPLFAQPYTNYRITSNSPARGADSSGSPNGDVGALFYVNDPTEGLQGILRQSTTLTLDNSPYTMPGDLVVPTGVTLNIEPGVVINPSSSDNMSCGYDQGKVELLVSGTLNAPGTASNRITFASTSNSPGTWGGLRFEDGATAGSLNYLEIAYGTNCVWTEASNLSFLNSVVRFCSGDGYTVNKTTSSLTLNGTPTTSRIESNTGYGVKNGGALTITASTIASNRRAGVYSSGNSQLTRNFIRSNGTSDNSGGYGVYLLNSLPSGNQSMSANLVYGNHVGGIYVQSSQAGTNDLIEHNTIDANTGYSSTNYGIRANVSNGTVTVRDNIVTSNGEYGLYRESSGGTIAVSYNNIWDHSISDVTGTGTNAGGVGAVSCNPLYSYSAGNDYYRLTSNSPSRMADSFGNDQGALFHVADDTPTLQGILRSSRTLTKAGSPWAMPGDLIIPPGVTLTLEPGAVLQPAFNSDAMKCGLNNSRAELVVRGSLVVAGTSSERVLMRPQFASKGYWEGVRFEPTSTANSVNYLDIEGAVTGVRVQAPGITLSNTRIREASTYGVLVDPSPASLVMTGEPGKHGGNFLLESAIWNVGTTTGQNGIYAKGDLTLSNTDVYNTYDHGVVFEAKATITHNRIHNATRGWGIWGGLARDQQDLIQHNLIYANYYGGIRINANSTLGTGKVTIDHNTIDGNNIYSSTTYGIYVSQTSGSTSTIPITNNIISNNGQYGVYSTSSTYRPAPAYNDYWNNSTANLNTATGSGNLFLDPLYNYPEASTTSHKDFRLQPPSNVRGKDNGSPTAGDMGALPFHLIPVDNVQVTPANGNVPAATARTFAAQAYEGWSNFPIRGIPYAWAVVNGGGTINSAGNFTAGCTLGAYADSIQATAGGVPGATTVNIVPGAAASVSVSPTTATIDVNQSQTYTATAKDSCGNTTTGNVTWSITNPLAGVIDANGVFTANVYSGTYTDVVRAAIGAVSGFASVTVNPDAPAFIIISPDPAVVNVGSSAQFTATGRDQWNNVVNVTPTWSVAPGCSAGTIDPVTGVFTASATPAVCSKPNAIRATQGTVTGNAAVEVKNIPVTCISVEAVSPSNGSTQVKGTIQYKARGWSAGSNGVCSGTELGITPTWSVTGPGNTVDASGRFTAGCGTGSFTVTAQSGAVSGSTTATVTAGGVASITVAPTNASVAVGATQTFTASGMDACNNSVSVTPVWSVVGGGGTIGASSGIFTAGSAVGTFANTIQASSAGVSGYASVSVTAGPLASITINPSPATVGINGTVSFTATGADSAGNPVSITPTWSVVNGGGTINSSTGLFTAGGTAGTFNGTIRASSGAVSATASITINPGPLASIDVTPNTASIAVNGSQQFTAIGKDAGGNSVPVTPTWAVTAGGGNITSGGLFTAGTAVGTFTNTVRATSGAVSGSASVTVTPGPLDTITVSPASIEVEPGGQQTFTASGKDAYGNPISPLTVTWSRATSAVGTINSTTGAFTAGNTAGTYADAIVATSSGKTGTASVTIKPGALASITVSPTSATLKINETRQFTATGRDAVGNTVPLTNPVWSVTDANAGSIDSTGLFTAGTRPGTYSGRIRVEEGSISATASVTVTVGALATIEVSPSTASVVRNTTQQFSAAGKDAAGNTVSTGTIVWEVVNGGGTINSSGRFTAGATAGTYPNTVRATGTGGVQGFATVQVTQAPLASITIAPTSATLAINGTRQFTATGRDANGDDVDVSVSWTVLDPAAGSIDSNGLFTAGTTPGTYNGAVQASSGSISATASIVVTPGPLATIEVTPNPATVDTNATRAFTATGKDAAGNQVTITPTWTVVNGGGSINSSGVFTAGATTGTFSNTVRATSGGISGFATVTVNQAPLARIVISPDPASVSINGTVTFTAAGQDANGNAVSAPIAWSVLDSSVGSINASSGVFTAKTRAGSFPGVVRASSGAISATAGVTVNPGPLASLTIDPSSTTVQVGATRQFTALPRDAHGNPVTAPISWSVSDASAGTIDGNGLFTAKSLTGTFSNLVKASSGAFSANATVEILPGALATIVVTPANPTLNIGQQQQFSAVGKDASGNTVPVTFTWSLADAAAGSITNTGLFTAGTIAGSFADVVRVTANGLTSMASVTINPGPIASVTVSPKTTTATPGSTRVLDARARDAHGNLVASSFAWEVIDPSVGTLVPAADTRSATLTASTTAGSFPNAIKVSAGSAFDTADVIITPGALTKVVIQPSPAMVPVATQIQFTARGEDGFGNEVTISPSWSMVTPAAGTITVNGRFTSGNTAGSYPGAVRASAGGLQAFGDVVVQPGAVASITISPPFVTIGAGETQEFTAVAKDSAGNVLQVNVDWNVKNSQAGSINANGLFTAGTRVGTYSGVIEASSGSASATATVAVRAGALARLNISPKSVTVKARTTHLFTVSATDQYGNAVVASPQWAVTSPSAGSITGSGLFSAGSTAGSYPAAVRASVGNIAESADVIVGPGDLDRVLVTPANATLKPGQSQIFTAEGVDADGNSISLDPSWSVTNPLAGSIDSTTGLFVAGLEPGSYANAVKATSNGRSGFASITVSIADITRVVIAPENPTVPMGRTVQFTAVAYDSADREVRGVSASWKVVAGGGTIDGATGLFTAGLQDGSFSQTVEATIGDQIQTSSVIVPFDFDEDRMGDAWEVANGLDNTDPADAETDLDDDGLTNLQEFEIGSLPRDADSDDDGVTDGNEQRPGEDTDGDGQVNALDPDSDNDGLLDGVEMSVTQPHADTDVSKGNFKVDEHPGSSTDPLNADTDGDSIPDGKEDANRNGRIDPGETDPNHADTLCPSGTGCPAGLVCSSGVCVNPASGNPDGGTDGCDPACGDGQTCNPTTLQCEDQVANVDQGCGCSSTGSAPLLWAGLALAAMALRRRVRVA